PIPTAEILVEARAADLARLAFGLRPAVHEFVAHVRLPLADERDLDHDEGLSRTKARRSLRVSVPRGPPRLGDFRADTFKVDAIMAQDGRVDQDFSEAIRVDRAGLSTWARVTEARAAPEADSRPLKCISGDTISRSTSRPMQTNSSSRLIDSASCASARRADLRRPS